jgi:trans-2,3-dihydro-3-hydroxyanthranilate isomerase
MKTIPYYHVDVFSDVPLNGNGLTVFTYAEGFSKSTMLKLTQEMRQFESVFLQKLGQNTYRVHIFTCEEELDFAGHPALGAAATLHDLFAKDDKRTEWNFIMNAKSATLVSEKRNNGYHATMNQGNAEFGKILTEAETAWLLTSIGLNPDDLYPGIYPTVVSTGLPYVIIPLQKNAVKAKTNITDLLEKIKAFGAHFIGTLEIPTLTIRSFGNLGSVEDIATGSLAGPVGAFLIQHGFYQVNTVIRLNQGGNLGRPSQLFVEIKEKNGDSGDILVSGDVVKVSRGELDIALSAYIHDNFAV